jgi:hypothetical protein
MTITDTVTPLPPYVPPYYPVSNITPFTYRDGLTYLQVLEGLRCYINDTIIPFINDNFSELANEFVTQVNTMIDTVNTALAEQSASVDQDIADLTAYVDNAIAGLNAPTVNDPIMHDVIANVASATRVLLDTLYAPKATTYSKTQVDSADATVATNAANATAATNARVAKLEALPTFYAGNYGFVADGATDDVVKMNQFLTDALAAGAVATLQKGKTYAVGGGVIVPSGSRFNLNGATIKQLGVGVIDLRVVYIDGVTDVEIWGGTIDGNKGAYAAVAEQRHALMVRNSSFIKIHDMKLYNAKGDGLYIGDNIAGGSTDVFGERVVCDSNWRNGMSISAGSGMRFVDCIFSNTAGTAPQAGVDIEPNINSVVCENIRFVNCGFNNNANGAGFQVSLQAIPTARQAGIYLYGCVSKGNAKGAWIHDATELSWIGGGIELNTGIGVHFAAGYGTLNKGVKFIGVDIKNNQRDGISVDATAQIMDLIVSNCTISGNSQLSAGGYHGIYIQGLAGSINVNVNNCFFEDVKQHYHLRTASTVANFTSIGNRFTAADAGGGMVLLQDDIPSRVQFDSLGSKALSGTTAQRPASTLVVPGSQYFDSSLGKPIWNNGGTWRDAAGATV